MVCNYDRIYSQLTIVLGFTEKALGYEQGLKSDCNSSLDYELVMRGWTPGYRHGKGSPPLLHNSKIQE